MHLKGFSYGFRPGRSPHQEPDALSVGIHRKRVNWVLDASTAGFLSRVFCILIQWNASSLLIRGGSRMRKRARTVLCGGRSVMVIPTASACRPMSGGYALKSLRSPGMENRSIGTASESPRWARQTRWSPKSFWTGAKPAHEFAAVRRAQL